jgi:CheY-like chemotaxis protein
MLESLVAIIRVQARQKGIEVLFEPASDLPDGVCGDEKRLGQVLLNLLGNAVKFTEQGRVTLRVETARRAVSDTETGHRPVSTIIRFEISDTGIGIPEDKLEDIFSPFKQIGEHVRQAKGTGLGLAISRQVVQLMGGDLSVRSTVGQGSVFRFEIPLPEVVEWKHAEQALEARQIIGYTPSKDSDSAVPKILVVDDTPENRQVLMDMVTSLGFDVEEAVDGRDGVEKAAAWQPDLIFMDLVMPVMNGFEATQEIRRAEEQKSRRADSEQQGDFKKSTISQPVSGQAQIQQSQIKIVAVSASSTLSSQEILAEAAFDGFLPKPILLKELLRVLETQLQITWQYEQSDEADEDTGEIVVPERAELDQLFELAEIGDFTELQARLERLEQMDERYRRFIRQIRKLARTYQDKDICTLIDQYRPST